MREEEADRLRLLLSRSRESVAATITSNHQVPWCTQTLLRCWPAVGGWRKRENADADADAADAVDGDDHLYWDLKQSLLLALSLQL